VEFVPNAPLPASTNLVMKLNGVLDLVGHPVNFTSNFQTGSGPDFTAPSVVWTSVTNNESVPTNMSMTVQFSESMDVTTFSNSNFFIQDSLLGTHIPTTLSWSADQSVAYLVPTAPLAAGRQYYFYVYSGTDLAGNNVQGTSFYFYAEFNGASSAPTAVLFNPLNGATGLGTNAIIEAQFSGPLDPNTLTGVKLTTGGTTVPTTASLNSGNSVVQLAPLTPLAPNTTYLMTIAGVKDPAGNAVATVTNSFTTGATFDITAPSAVNYTPVYNSTVGTNEIPKIVFNKPLNPITVSNSTFQMHLADTNQWIPLTVTPSANGLEVTLQPQIPLLPSTRYHFQACCGFQDQDGNNGNGVDAYFYTSGGADTSGPTVTVSPINAATGIPLNAQIIVTSSAQIDSTTWSQSSVQLLDNLNHAVAGTVAEPGSQTLTFTPTSALSPSITYTVKVNHFSDVNGNAVVPFSSTFTTAATAATGGLTLVSTNIPFGATGVSNTQQIILTFSQILDPTTVNSNTLLVMNSWNSNYGLAGTYAVSGNQVTFTPTSPYPPGAQIYMGECGGPTDVLGEVFLSGSCYGQQLISFTVVTGSPDTTALKVLSVNPASGATGVRPDVPVSITFNKSINPYSVYNNGNNALLFAGQGLQDRGNITMSADDRTLTFNSGTLYTGTSYTISLPAGGITDPSGNTLASTFTSTFTTGTNPATGNGSVQSVSPGANATGVPTDSLLTLYLNRQVDAATVTGSNVVVAVNGNVYAGALQSAAGGYEVQFTPTVPFPNGAVVQWFFSNVYDVNGDAFNGDSGTFYVVGTVNTATATPQVIGVSPAYGSSNVPTNAEVDIEYNLPISAASLAGNVYFTNGTVAMTISQPSPNIVRLTPTSPLTAATTYYVCANASVKGTNTVPAQTDCYATYFTTTSGADTSSGTVAVGPPNNSVSVGTNAYVRLVFSKPVDLTSINNTNVQVSSGGVAIPGTWSYVYTNNDVMGANYSPVNPLPPSTNIEVSVNGLRDYVGNEFTGVTSQFTTGTTPDYSAPTAALDFPNGQTGIATNASFTCLYSEPMDPSSILPSNTFVYSYGTSTKIPVTYKFSADMLSVTMTPTSALTANAEFYYQCSGAIDLTGNGMNGTSYYFYTGSGPTSTGPTAAAG
jgi:hypothetical protein